MKTPRFFPMPLLAMLLFFSLSCNDASEETTTTTDTASRDTSAATTPEVTPPTTIVTTPENIMIVRHKVKNFAKWKEGYEQHDSARLANGLHSYVIGRGVQDSNMVLVAVKVDDTAKAKAFGKSPGLKAAMQKAGVVGTPTIRLTTVVYQDNAPNMPDLRSMTFFKVKDWDAWKASFESHRQTRIDNGIVDRGYGYDVDDNHKVILVTALVDSAKAAAFWKSDLLKQRRAESGVIGEPERFVYRVVQKY